MARTDWIDPNAFKAILMALMPENRLALEVSRRHGLRIGDVLNLKTEDIKKKRFTIREVKTGKRRRVTLSDTLQNELLSISGRLYVFENRTDWKKHRIRQTVYKDLKKACKALRIPSELVIAPHSARKIWASEFAPSELKRVQRILNHSDEAITLVYLMARELTCRSKRKARAIEKVQRRSATLK